MESALNQQPAAAPNGSAQSPVPAQIEAAIATLHRLADAEARRLPEAFQPALQTAHADLIVILSDLAKAVTAVRDGDPRQIGPAFEVALETANKWADRFCFDITEKPVWLDFETRAREVVESLPATITTKSPTLSWSQSPATLPAYGSGS